jgi:hypothetical protein
MRRIELKRVFILISCTVFLYIFPGCTFTRGGIYVGEHPKPGGGPPPHAPAHGYRAQHTYRYYPSAQVYFDTSRRVYFYLDGQGWRVSTSLPGRFHIAVGDYVNIDMESDRPYTAFDKHKKKYPPGHKKNKKDKKWVNKK